MLMYLLLDLLINFVCFSFFLQLEEIKTKERNIGQLKKDLQILQNSKTLSRNATTLNTTTTTTTTTNQTTNKTTISNAKMQNTKKPKISISNTNAVHNKQNEESSKETTKNKNLNKKSDNTNEVSNRENILNYFFYI